MFEQELRPSDELEAPEGGGGSRATSAATGICLKRRMVLWSLVWAALAVAGLVMGAMPNNKGTRDDKLSARPTEANPAPQFPVIIRRPAGAPRVAMGLTNFQGQAVFASCASCHATTRPNLETRSYEDLDEFHQGLKYDHGDLTCLSCHNSANYETLRLADTRAVEFSDVKAVCSQCHGPQRRDYDRGLHGGMNGYWDLTRGGRTRNSCVDCHDPHVPAFPMVLPVLPPLDRIAVPRKDSVGTTAPPSQSH